MEFQKYSGAGNKFIIFDNRDNSIGDRTKTVLDLFKGGDNEEIDGVIFLESSNAADFHMNYYNRDGTADSLCGNGLRCTVRYIKDNGFAEKNDIIIESIGKLFHSLINDDGRITVTFPSPGIIRSRIKLKVNFSDWSEDLDCSYIDVDTPHIVIFVDEIGNGTLSLEDIKVDEWGRNVRMHKDLMPEGANVNFVTITGENSISMRTYERGVERETLACGTGALASAIAAFTVKGVLPPVDILARSGDTLTVGFSHSADDIGELTLTGPAVRI